MSDVRVPVKFLKRYDSYCEGEVAGFYADTAAHLVKVGLAEYLTLPPAQPAPDDGPPVETKVVDGPPADKMVHGDASEKKGSGFFGRKLKR